MSNPILSYPLSDSNNIGQDVSSNSLDITPTDVTIVNDATMGNVASFNGTTSKLVLDSSSVPVALNGDGPRTVSAWIYHTDTSDTRRVIFSQGPESPGRRFRVTLILNQKLAPDISGSYQEGTTELSENTWYHVAFTYNGSEISTYINGVFENTWVAYTNVSVSDFIIGEDETILPPFLGYMKDFRVYDRVLSSTELVDISTIQDISASNITPFSADITWVSDSQVDMYLLTRYETSLPPSTETRVKEVEPGGVDITVTDTNLESSKSYTYQVYSRDTSSSAYQVCYEVLVDTLSESVSNYSSITSVLQNESGELDLTMVHSSSLDYILNNLETLLANEAVIKVRVNSSELSGPLVHRGQIIPISTNNSIFVPFTTTDTSQSITLVSSDNSSTQVFFDEVSEEITVDGTQYAINESFVLDGKKVTMYSL